jgi:hypothetical protein
MNRLTPRTKEGPEKFRLTCLPTLGGRLRVIAPPAGSPVLVLVDSLIPEYGGNLFNKGVLFDRAGQTNHVDSMTGAHRAGEVRWGAHGR